MSKNLHYLGENIADFYQQHRRTWDELYPSEQRMFEKLVASKGEIGSVLDVGCAVGGLGNALFQKFGMSRYTGIDINPPSIEVAQQTNFPFQAQFHCGDILEMSDLPQSDVVVSLGCADFNCSTSGIIKACWESVKPGGHLVISLRLTEGESINDITRSFQKITFGDDSVKQENLEIAPYVILNCRDALQLMGDLSPSKLSSYGYWGQPSSTAVTPVSRVVFSVWLIEKPAPSESGSEAFCDLQWPWGLLIGASS